MAGEHADTYKHTHAKMIIGKNSGKRSKSIEISIEFSIEISIEKTFIFFYIFLLIFRLKIEKINLQSSLEF